ncbi:aldose 1-epimerase [Lacisediminimonas sp.]|uniref:aldose 1-epimerase n=1 Tax=Lacisediminimonas sp. TaxID=3060582 RepID=UPI0027196EE0|nr:aldose 1-epimerase [Lacisediminimonas sp.]MDO8298431.1 aldose 1-epimerase [Lacisediminimonas sp.]
METRLLVLENAQQRLRLVPELGGGIASWDWKPAAGEQALLRAWDGVSDDRYTLACFPLLPWSNRITQGGFAHHGVHHPIRNNRHGEPYPIHGDGWLQPWHVLESDGGSAVLGLSSRRFDGNPYEYDAEQGFELLPEGLRVSLKVTHRGRTALPYGLGLHPYFVCNSSTRLQARSSGVWLSGEDAIPITYSTGLPVGWDFNEPAAVCGGGLIDNCFSGWDGVMRVAYPDSGLGVLMRVAPVSGYSLLYRPAGGGFFCFEPISHPIDAFHVKAKPGLVSLRNGESLRMLVSFSVSVFG